MTNMKKQAMNIVGISTRTSNQNAKAEKDIPALWQKFMTDNIGSKIPNKVDETVYALYSDYEGDHTLPYTITIGYKVGSLDNIPEDLTVKIVPEANYAQFFAEGNLTKDAVINKWMEIWNMDLPRSYKTDLEIYDDRAIDPTNGIAEILISVK
ncbi:GyrI-like domain-containing protein [Croceitalea rosinachiae]|uniref:GyrI-like domain-containing protein n=1 Tax=Croceitalea rosinachiae TaxID=3075596 RepID=A0ABU3A965_9FLAO|nr:GyrI-like domain-containing protein [Croceitalea sp. F388]MDT0606724.1 GyrI-like domain-containing protein [Croceitalea sp. F388]